MRTLEHLFDNNRKWAADLVERDPKFFEDLAKQQKPKHLWIGCSDSRVPANQIVGLDPGEVFVHRNIANQVIYSDLNCMSVIEYAVEVLKVNHIIVCGHYGCGGVQAATQQGDRSVAQQWIGHIRDVRRQHQTALESIADERVRLERLCELNLIEQVRRLCRSNVVESAWNRGAELCVHGWIYRIDDGLLNDLDLCIAQSDEVTPIINAAITAK